MCEESFAETYGLLVELRKGGLVLLCEESGCNRFSIGLAQYVRTVVDMAKNKSFSCVAFLPSLDK